tara:strand:- start:158 stop:424 length:267 start_codon:yes stop_codon:yes gene_type:complete
MDLNMDLNIDNYDFDDILTLFKLPYHYSEKDLKATKKKVLRTHPDKSGLDKDYFLFFPKHINYYIRFLYLDQKLLQNSEMIRIMMPKM